MNLDLNSFFAEKGRVHFIGCGGAGTQPMMCIFHQLGFRVSGSDLLDNTPVQNLKKRGMRVELGHDAKNLPPDDGSNLLVIYTSAASDDNPELAAARARGAVCIRRGEALGCMTSLFKRIVTVSGSHGKTSVSAMIAFALKELGADPGYLIGGEVCTWDYHGDAGNGDIFVSEVDESDGTHTFIRSSIGVVTNAEDDHAWNVGGAEALRNNFLTYAANSENLIFVGSPSTDELFGSHPQKTRLSPNPAEYSALQLFEPEALANWGGYQRMNALTALAVLTQLGFLEKDAAQALSRFPGVERRMTVRFESPELKVIEDYAHHPTELRVSLDSMRQTHPGRRLVILFQPHRYARLERYFDEFAAELSRADQVFVAPVFSAWTASGSRNSADLACAVGNHACYVDGTWSEMAQIIRPSLQKGDLFAVIGAGDIKEILPFFTA